MKTNEKHRARILRREHGMSIKEIARAVGVARSSVSVWVRDIDLSAEQRAMLARRNPLFNRQINGAATNSANGRARRLGYQAHGRMLAARGDPFHAAGCMLFWAEGSKRRDAVVFVNSDPEMVRFFLEFVHRYFGVSDRDVRLRCNLFADHLERQREIEQFWLDCLGLPRSSLLVSHVNVYSKYSQKKRQNRLPYGTSTLLVHRTHVVQSIYGSIQEYAGFDRPEWLG